MTHNQYDYTNDIFEPIKKFFEDNHITFGEQGDKDDHIFMCQLEYFRNVNEVPEEYAYETLIKSKR